MSCSAPPEPMSLKSASVEKPVIDLPTVPGYWLLGLRRPSNSIAIEFWYSSGVSLRACVIAGWTASSQT